MVGEASRCPECGAELPAGNARCPLCGPDVRWGRATFDRSRKRRLAALIVSVVIVLSAIVLQPIMHELSLAPSQKLIVTADDLGPGWGSGEPEKMTNSRAATTDTAYVRLQYLEGSKFVESHCELFKFQAQEQADAYYLEHRDEAATSEDYVSMEFITVADHAYTTSSNMYGHDGWSRHILMQEGSWIASIYLHTDGVDMDEELIIHAAEAQAAKLP